LTPGEGTRAVLAHWGLAAAAVAPYGAGLINQTFVVTADGARYVLQRVSPVFSPVIHANIRAVTERLAASGLVTPRLVPTRAGEACVDLDGQVAEGGVWRLLTLVDGVSFETVQSPAQAHAAGALLARFHGALEGMPHTFVGLRVGVHDTAKHLSRLRQAVDAHGEHRLSEFVRPLTEEIMAAANSLPPLPQLPARVCHGDPKLNNIVFAGPASPACDDAVCFIDLDGVGPSSLAFELGDAWRSWCNRAGEDAPSASLDLAVFRASADGYRAGLGRPFTVDESRALLLGVEWLSLELAARFAADALEERYFRWNPEQFGSRGEHNLVRARGQWSLHRAFLDTRADRTQMLRVNSDEPAFA